MNYYVIRHNMDANHERVVHIIGTFDCWDNAKIFVDAYEKQTKMETDIIHIEDMMRDYFKEVSI